MSADYKHRLWIVIVLNAAMFLVETGAGYLAQSQALQADALDFLGDALTYGISLAVIGKSARVRSTAALAKGMSLAVIIAALAVWGTATGWPDVIVAAAMAGLFLSSSFQIITRALHERRNQA